MCTPLLRSDLTIRQRRKALEIVVEDYSSHWNRTQSRKKIRHKMELDEEDEVLSCLGWLPSYITACFTSTASDIPATRLPLSSENVAVKYTPPQAAQNRSILHPGCTLLPFNLTMLATLWKLMYHSGWKLHVQSVQHILHLHRPLHVSCSETS